MGAAVAMVLSAVVVVAVGAAVAMVLSVVVVVAATVAMAVGVVGMVTSLSSSTASLSLRMWVGCSEVLWLSVLAASSCRRRVQIRWYVEERRVEKSGEEGRGDYPVRCVGVCCCVL
jgi:hypothetical protein